MAASSGIQGRQRSETCVSVVADTIFEGMGAAVILLFTYRDIFALMVFPREVRIS